MKTEEKITVTLTSVEVENIIKEYIFNKRGITIDDVYFDIQGHEDPDDHFSECSLDYVLEEVVCEGHK